MQPHPYGGAWSLSDDRQVLTMHSVLGGVVEMGWDHPATDQELKDALISLMPLIDEFSVEAPSGTDNVHRRFRTRWGSIFVSFLSGPPTWWLPRVLRRKDSIGWGFCVGWLRRGIAVSFRPKSTGPHVVDGLDAWQEIR